MNDLFNSSAKCLIVQTKFSAYSFWNYQEVCDIVGAKYPATPLGLLTVAALLPQHWTFKLIDENVEPVLDEHLLWADLVCVGGMLPQQKSMLEFIDRAHKLNCTLVVGGADPTSQPELYYKADYLVLGEGELSIPMFLEDLKKGATKGIYKPEGRADMLQAVIPRYDLIRFSDYIMVGLQFVRGCPFGCEFCDIIELFGRVPRYKTNQQILDEMQRLYDLGYRGHIDFVDDNFIGNKKKVKELLHEVKKWTIAHKYPFYFTTEASVNLADDDELLQLMQDVDFRYVFLGIETPENETLKLTHKTQNVNRSVTDAVKKIMSYGMVCNGGFIIGFDSDSPSIDENMIACVQNSGICMAMVGLLYGLPNTQLTQRLEREGRLFTNKSKSLEETDIDQSTSGLNFITLIPRNEIIRKYIHVLEYIYDPKNYYKRILYTAKHLKTKYRHVPNFRTWLLFMRSFLRVCKHATLTKSTRRLYWRMFFTTLFRNPKSIEAAVNLAAMFIHFHNQKEYVINAMETAIQKNELQGEEALNSKMTGKMVETVSV